MPVTTPSQDTLATLFLATLLQQSPLTNVQPTSAATGLANANAALMVGFYQALNLQVPSAVLAGLYNLFNFNPLPATPSTTAVVFSGTPGTQVPVGMLVGTMGTATTPAITFSTTTSGTVTTSGTLSLAVTSTQTGIATQVGTNTITTIVSPLVGITTVTNPQAATGGANAESPSAQQQRFTEYEASKKGATVPAIQYGLGPSEQSTVQQLAVIPPFTLIVLLDQGGTFTNVSDSMASPKGVPVSPWPTSLAVGDAVYVGCSTLFNKLYWDVDQAGSGGSYQWQYWSQTANTWSPLTLTLDETSQGQQSGTTTWDLPADWVPTSVDTLTYFWIRLTATSATYTTLPAWYQLLPLQPPPGFVQIVGQPPTGTEASVMLRTLQGQGSQWVGGAETGIFLAATEQTLNLTVTITPTLYGSQVLTTSLVSSTLTQYLNTLGIGNPFQPAQASYVLQQLYNGTAIANATFTVGTVYVPPTTVLVPGTITVTINAV